jgi:hypothetical protein
MNFINSLTEQIDNLKSLYNLDMHHKDPAKKTLTHRIEYLSNIQRQCAQ